MYVLAIFRPPPTGSTLVVADRKRADCTESLGAVDSSDLPLTLGASAVRAAPALGYRVRVDDGASLDDDGVSAFASVCDDEGAVAPCTALRDDEIGASAGAAPWLDAACVLEEIRVESPGSSGASSSGSTICGVSSSS